MNSKPLDKKIKLFVESIKDPKTGYFLTPKIYSKSFVEIFSIILAYTELDYKNRVKHDEYIYPIVEHISAYYIRMHRYEEARKILDRFEIIYWQKYEAGTFSFSQVINFSIKHIYALSNTNYFFESIERTNSLLRSFHKAEKNCTLLNETENKEREYGLLYVHLKSLMKYMRRRCVQMNFVMESSKYHKLEKEFDAPIQTLYIGGHISELNRKLRSKIKFMSRIIIGIVINRISKFFWDWGENVYKIARLSSLVILFYTL